MVASNLAATAQMLAFQCEMKMNPEFSVDVENRLNLYRSMQAQDEYLRLSEARKRVIQDEMLPPNGPPLLKGDRFSLGAHSPLRGGALYSDPGAPPLSFGGRPPRPEKARKPYQPWLNGSKRNVAAGGIAGPSMLSKGSIPIQVDAPGRAMALPRKTQINKPARAGPAQTHASRLW